MQLTMSPCVSHLHANQTKLGSSLCVLQTSVKNVTAFKAHLFNDFNPNAGSEFNTVQNFWKECSFGKVRCHSLHITMLVLGQLVCPACLVGTFHQVGGFFTNNIRPA